MRAPTLLHEFLDDARAHRPDAVAIDVPPTPDRPTRRTLTYAELWARSGEIARSIANLTRPDTVVAIMLPRTTPDLFAAQIGVNRAHGAFTCPDPKFPDAHLRAVLENAGVRVVIGDRASLERVAGLGLTIERAVDVDDVPTTSDEHADDAIISANGKAACERCLAYMISTSGTTGTPKGVMIEHRGIVNLIASDLDEFRLGPGDRVGQGSSAAYDSSIEETWLALASGATLVVLDDTTMRLGPDLTQVLRQERISVFCPPPTLLRTTGCADPQRELPDLRLLYVGGEALPQDLAERWAAGKRLVNGYGPTECSVTVVRGDVRVGDRVTIGTPVRGHTAHILDDRLAPVPDGQAGELCIAGPGLARGYRGREELTREKFPVLPGIGRVYRTGDLAQREADGRLQYLGRIDAQVKIHGYRIELEAIEARLAEHAGVREAACCVQGSSDAPVLCAFIVPSDVMQRPSHAVLRAHLRDLLPVYMVPSRWADLDELPRTVGGKIDRRRLPTIDAETPEGDSVREGSDGDARDASVDTQAGECAEVEAVIRRAFASTLRRSVQSITLDVPFSDLPGGDSIGAIALTCELRRFPATARLTTRDVYEAPTVRALAARAAASQHDQDAEPVRIETIRAEQRAALGEPIGTPRPALITTLQGLWVLLWLSVWSAIAYAMGFEVLPMIAEHAGLWVTLALGPVLAVGSMVAYALLSIAVLVLLKRLLIGAYTPMTYRLWSGTHLRHWIVEQGARAVPWSLLSGTTALNAVLRLLGARVGARVHIHRGVNVTQGGWDLLTIGDDATLACDAWMGLVELDNSCARVAPVTIGRGALIDVRAGVGGGARVGDGAHLQPLAWLADDASLSDGESFGGVPARSVGRADLPAPEHDRAAGAMSATLHAFVMLAIEAVVRAFDALLLLAGVIVGVMLLGVSERDVLSWLSSPTISSGGVVWTLAGVVIATPIWLVWRAVLLRLLGTVREGEISRWSLAYIRVWHKTRVLEACGRWLSGTLFWPVWLRLAGMRIGPRCEVSTIIDVVPELVEIGTESFFADGIYLGGPRIAGGRVRLGRTTLGGGTFLGNHAVLPAGAYKRGMFVGVSTVASPGTWAQDTGWFGIPALRLHRREVVQANRTLTFSPGPVRYATRVFWEVLRFGMGVPVVLSAHVWLWMIEALASDSGVAVRVALAAPLATLTVLAAECLAVVMLKWALLGRARAGQHALWSCWCSRWDFLYVVWQFCAGPQLTLLQGSLLLNAYLRLTGVRIGRRVALGPGFAQVVDPDMLTFEDDTTIAAHFQAHSFEDRVLKLAPVVVRRGSTIAEQAVVFFGTDIGERSLVSPNSVVMKNERVEPGTCVAGSPLKPMRT
jgi:non-ribosomal peptide synthetase-like protein